jgi:hypothetical protein
MTISTEDSMQRLAEVLADALVETGWRLWSTSHNNTPGARRTSEWMRAIAPGNLVLEVSSIRRSTPLDRVGMLVEKRSSYEYTIRTLDGREMSWENADFIRIPRSAADNREMANFARRTIFVSGHLDLTEEEFAAHYAPRLSVAIADQAAFVVGDARGCDRMAQEFLRNQPVRVFHMLTHPRHNIGGFPTAGGFLGDDDRDEAMTRASDEDLAWVRPGRESSGTAKNLQRRVQK